jgi:hypothetical protein
MFPSHSWLERVGQKVGEDIPSDTESKQGKTQCLIGLSRKVKGESHAND